MRAFACPVCGRLVTFESERCLHCGHELGVRLGRAPDRRAARAAALRGQRLAGCNGLVAEDGDWCASCALTRTRPADGDARRSAGLRARRGGQAPAVFELLELELPVVGWREREGGLAFDLLSSRAEPVTTGHADGVITLDLDETDDAQREQRREALGEPYRTVLGHMRHEIAHYYQDILAPEGSAARAECRAALRRRSRRLRERDGPPLRAGAPAGWEQRYVSAYATMHPWEDWAETFAHYLHIRDTLQTAEAYGVRVDGPQVATTDSAPLHSDPDDDAPDLETLLDAWLPLTYALNAINRSMGAADVYPFVSRRRSSASSRSSIAACARRLTVRRADHH